MEKTDLILKALKDSNTPLKTGELVEKTGLDKKEADKAIKVLKKEEKIFSPMRCFYQAK